MRWAHLVTILILATVWSSCSSQRWIHPTKKEAQLTHDYNACERDIMNSMATSPGTAGLYSNVSIEQERIAKCLQNKGWRLVEDK